MRKIGEIASVDAAQLFSDALLVRGIRNDVEDEESGSCSIWVHDDDQREAASLLLQQFQLNPSSTEWAEAQSAAEQVRRSEEREDRTRTSKVITREQIEYHRQSPGISWPVALLIALCVLATAWAGDLLSLGLGGKTETNEHRAVQLFQRRQTLAMTEWTRLSPAPTYDLTLPEIRHGQIWRLFSSTFVHFGILHLVFNLLWLKDLGDFIQKRQGTAAFFGLVAAFAILSTYGQLWWAGPNSGGFSGVNYGLFGYLWVRGQCDRTIDWQLNPQVISTMLLWFFLCLSGISDNIANGAHAAGLLSGMLFGYLAAKIAWWRLHRS